MGVYSKPILESGEMSFNNPIEHAQLLLDIDSVNHSLFEAVIELDFAEAYNEAGLASLTESEIEAIHEAETKNFKEKINGIIEKVKAWLYDFFGSMIRAFKNIISNDVKIKEKYDLSKLDADRKKKFDACEKVVTVIDAAKFDQKYDELENMIDELYTALTKAADGTDVNLISSITEKAKKVTDDFKMSDVVVKVKVKELSGTNFDRLVGAVNNGYKKEVENYKDANKRNKNIIEKAKAYASKIKESKDSEEAKKAAEASKAISTACTLLTKLEKAASYASRQAISVERTAYLQIGRAVGAVPGKESVAEPGKETTNTSTDNKGGETAEKVSGDVVDKDGNVVESAELQEAYDLLIEMENEEYMSSVFVFA